jgi:hypothetical protein
MSNKYEAISAFLDDASFNPVELEAALSEPEGRAFLIDLIAVRRLVQPSEAMPSIRPQASAGGFQWRIVAAAAVLFVGLTGGYFIAAQRSAASGVDAPPATRVVEAVPFIPSGGGR